MQGRRRNNRFVSQLRDEATILNGTKSRLKCARVLNQRMLCTPLHIDIGDLGIHQRLIGPIRLCILKG